MAHSRYWWVGLWYTVSHNTAAVSCSIHASSAAQYITEFRTADWPNG